MMAVMIGIDPHKASHTAAAIDGAEKTLGEVRVTGVAEQPERLLEWAAAGRSGPGRWRTPPVWAI